MANANKVALVTGGTRGIGLGAAKCLAAEGYDVIACGVRPEEQITDALDEIRQAGNEVIYCRCDVADAKARAAMMAQIREQFGQLNVLVNNAGVAPKVRADILDATEESFDRVLGINLKGPYFLTQAAANWMVEQRNADPDFPACIITVSSVSSTMASTNRGDYCISKAAVSMATQLWAARLGEYGIPAYEIRPGIIRTDMTEPVFDKWDKAIEGGAMVQSRWGMPDDVGKAVAMLARGDLPYSTGQVIMVDGGLALQRL